MGQWQTADAKQQFTQLVASAQESGPQVVMRHKEAVAVVLSADDYRRLVRQADANFAQRLATAPITAEDIADGLGARLGEEEQRPASLSRGRSKRVRTVDVAVRSGD